VKEESNLETIDSYFDRIAANPEHFPQKRKPYREAYIKRFPFIVIYEITSNKALPMLYQLK